MNAQPLRVGVDAAPPAPMCCGLPGEPGFEGFEVDLLRALARHLQRPLIFEASLWATLLERLQARRIDVICTAATITPERERQFLFSEPYLRTRLAVVSRRDVPIRTLEEFRGRVGVRESTPAEAYAVGFGLQPTRFHFNTEVYRALFSGSLDVVVDDFPIGAWFSRQSGGLQVSPLDGTDVRYATVMRRDDSALKTALDGAILATLADGSYASAYARWLEPVVGDACDVTAGARRHRW